MLGVGVSSNSRALGVPPAGKVEAKDHDRHRQAQLHNGCIVKYAPHPSAPEAHLNRLEALGLTTTQARVSAMSFGPSTSPFWPVVRRRSSLDYAGALGASRLRSLRSPLTRP
jgi:hypothetical protein